uniref:Glutathione peroxidase 4 n=1 Tax=Hucho hucho TaxID=62062 RepID=A0A4W5PQF5_9TELE
ADGLVYDFSAKDIDGNEVSLEKYRGDFVIIVNVFAEMHTKYAEKGLRILAFPSNQFGRQEPGTESQIKDFAKSYNADFPMFCKINVNGPNAHPLWKWLKEQPKGGRFLGNGIKWNFTKVYIYFLLVIVYSHQNKLTQLSWSNPELCAKKRLLSAMPIEFNVIAYAWVLQPFLAQGPPPRKTQGPQSYVDKTFIFHMSYHQVNDNGKEK